MSCRQRTSTRTISTTAASTGSRSSPWKPLRRLEESRPTKRVLPVAGDELPLLVTTLFAIPQKHGELQDRSTNLPEIVRRLLSREVPLTDAMESSAQGQRLQPRDRERIVGPMPGAVVQHFKGRGRELDSLRRRLADENVRLILVCGRGGIGKTSLITKLLHELQGGNSTLPQDTIPWEVEGIVYVALRQPEFRSPDKIVELICRTLESHAAQELRAKWQQQVSLADKLDFLFRRSLGWQHYLIVLDNFEDLLDSEHRIHEEFADLRQLVETCLEYDHGTRLLVTSRRGSSSRPNWKAASALGRPNCP